MADRSILIADSSEEFLRAMAPLLQKHHRVLVCRDGKTALELLHRESFHLLLLDLTLPTLDGLGLLEQLRAEGIYLHVLAFTPLLSEYVIDTAQRLDVSCLLRRPVNLQAIARRAEDLMRTMPISLADRHLVITLLTQLNIPAHLDGFRYLTECVLLFAANPTQAFTKELYPAVAKKVGKTGPQVERSMRNALKVTWKHAPDGLARYFSDRPISSDVITLLAEELRKQKE